MYVALLQKEKKWNCKLLMLISKGPMMRCPEKTYKVPERRGCGKLVLETLQALYRGTKTLLKSVIIDMSISVRQGAPTGCLLFILCMDQFFLLHPICLAQYSLNAFFDCNKHEVAHIIFDILQSFWYLSVISTCLVLVFHLLFTVSQWISIFLQMKW